MTPREMELALENVDHRTTAIEQILPTLATKDDLAAAVAPLATKADLEELRRETLGLIQESRQYTSARFEESRQYTSALFEESKRHMSILIEDVRDDIRMLAEHLASVLDRRPGPG